MVATASILIPPFFINCINHKALTENSGLKFKYQGGSFPLQKKLRFNTQIFTDAYCCYVYVISFVRSEYG